MCTTQTNDDTPKTNCAKSTIMTHHLETPKDIATVTLCDSTLNTANLCPAISVVGLFYLLTVMYTFVWFGTLVHFRWTVHSKL